MRQNVSLCGGSRLGGREQHGKADDAIGTLQIGIVDGIGPLDAMDDSVWCRVCTACMDLDRRLWDFLFSSFLTLLRIQALHSTDSKASQPATS